MNHRPIGGISIAYLDEGVGPPVSLAHCSSASHRMWRGLIDELAGRHRLIAPDLIGYGGSGKWPAGRRYEIGADARVLAELAATAGAPVHFVGHSFGGALVLEAVGHLGAAARAMTLIEPVAFPLLPLAGRMAEWREIDGIIAAVTGAMADGNRPRAAATYMGFWMGQAQWHLSPPHVRESVLDSIDKVALEFQACRDPWALSLESVRSLNVPTLLIHGTQTRAPAMAVVEELHGLLPDARVQSVAGAGHMSPLTHREQVNALILDHIAAHA